MRGAELDRTIDAIAVEQHGVVTRRQLLEAGVSAHAVDRRAREGRLRRVHRGVYRVGPVVAPLAAEMAAVLACGSPSFVCDSSAAVLWKLIPESQRRDRVDVVVPGRNRRTPGVRVHRVRTLVPEEVTTLEGIPIVTPGRALVEIAAHVGGRTLERAVAEAFALKLTDRKRLAAQLTLHPKARGVRAVSQILQAADPPRTESEAEERLLQILRATDLPQPRVNCQLLGFRVDFLWAAECLVVEVDGRAFHSAAPAFERDRRRDGMLTAAGYRVMRVTWAQLVNHPLAVVGRVALALGTGRRRER